MNSPSNLTQLLAQARNGSASAREDVLQIAYEALRGQAEAFLQNERTDHTLGATALVHEVCLEMLKGERLPCQCRAEFLGAAAKAMPKEPSTRATAKVNSAMPMTMPCPSASTPSVPR